MQSILQANSFHTAKALRIWDWYSILGQSSEPYQQTGIFCVEKTLEHCIIHTCGNSAEVGTIIGSIWSIPKLQRDFFINYKWHSIPVYSVSRRDHIFDYTYSLLGMPLNKFFSFRICCQMYLHDSIQFGRSRDLGGIIIPCHNYVATVASFF
jgi:hypothetical protein